MKKNRARFLKAKSSKGFTLIELLVVIAIIGILSTVVLTSLSQSQAKGYDSQIAQQLNQFRTAAQMYFMANGGYGDATACTEGMFNNFDSQNGNPGGTIAAGVLPNFSDLTCNSTSREYAVKATMYKNGEYWCVDSNGASRKVLGNPDPTSTLCP